MDCDDAGRQVEITRDRWPSRRQALLGLAKGAVAAVVAACSSSSGGPGSETDSSGPACGLVGSEAEGWVAVDLAAYPELLQEGGSAAVDVDDALLHVLVVAEDSGCHVAVWRVCTHGACEVTWDAEAGNVFCPCHSSRFATDGAVLVGPATEPLRAFEAIVDGETLWIHRPS